MTKTAVHEKHQKHEMNGTKSVGLFVPFVSFVDTTFLVLAQRA